MNIYLYIYIQIEDWKRIVEAELPEEENAPMKMNEFQKLLALKCLRPDRLTQGIQKFISENLGMYLLHYIIST